MLTTAFVYSRWSKCELRCYIDGNIVSSVEMAWPVTTSETFDKCLLGGMPDQREESLFSGRIASVMGFTEALSPHQITALYALGPDYRVSFVSASTLYFLQKMYQVFFSSRVN